MGAGIIWNINDRITTETGLNFNYSSFEYLENNIYTYDNLSMKETQLSMMIPISLKYTYVRSGISPYAYAGLSANFLFSADQQYVLENITPTYNGNEIIGFATQSTERDLNIKFRRDYFNPAFHLGIGARYKYSLDYIFVDLRYSFGLNNVVENNSLVRKEEDNESQVSYLAASSVGYVDDYFRLNQVTLTVGYIGPWYKPRKLKHSRTRGILRNIKKHNNEKI